MALDVHTIDVVDDSQIEVTESVRRGYKTAAYCTTDSALSAWALEKALMAKYQVPGVRLPTTRAVVPALLI
jgi:hypothetical protein